MSTRERNVGTAPVREAIHKVDVRGEQVRVRVRDWATQVGGREMIVAELSLVGGRGEPGDRALVDARSEEELVRLLQPALHAFAATTLLRRRT